LVVPKGLGALDSSLNLKLLKKEASKKDKQIIIVTSDSKLTSVAQHSGLLTAASLTAKPTSLEEGDNLASQAEDLDVNETVIDGGADSRVASKITESEEVDDIISDEAQEALTSDADNNLSSSKKLPDFFKFRKRIAVILGALLLVFSILFILLQKNESVVNLVVRSRLLDVNFETPLVEKKTAADSKDLVAVKVADSKQVEATLPTTGKKNIGAKASGSITLVNCTSYVTALTINAGTNLSTNGKNFTLNSDITLSPSVFNGAGVCISSATNGSITASESGVGSNLPAGTSMQVANLGSGLNVVSDNLTGGTDEIINIVDQKDIDGIADSLKAQKNDELIKILEAKVSDGSRLIADTLTVEVVDKVITPAVGERADNIVAKANLNFSALSVSEADIQNLIAADAKEKANGGDIEVLDFGMDSLRLEKVKDNTYRFTTSTRVTDILNTNDLKEKLKGKKRGEAVVIIDQDVDNLVESNVNIKPFWSSKISQDVSKIVINVSLEKVE
jgi:hypothetical protein